MMTDLSNTINNGFLLTRQVQDKHNGLLITLWLKSSVGPVKLEIENELAIFFVELPHKNKAKQILTEQNIAVAKENIVSLKTFNQTPVAAFYFTHLRNFYRAREALKLHNIKCFEDDIRPDDRFLMERHITADIDYISQHQITKTLSANQYQLAQQVKCKRADSSVFKQQLSMLSIDIECSMEGELYSIGLYAVTSLSNNCDASNSIAESVLTKLEVAKPEKSVFKQVLMIGEPKVSADDDQDDYIHWLSDEQQLLKAFIRAIISYDADILIGWNVINFDFMLLQKRCDLYNIPFAIGRDGSSPYWRKNPNNEDQHFIEIAGRVVLDGIDLLKTATYSFASFSLDNVAKALLGLTKKVTDVENRVKEITDNFHHNKPALAAYNLEDCRLVWLIFEKTQLLAFAKLRAQLTGLAIDRIGGSVAAFTNLYLPKLHRSGYVAPNMGDGVSGLVSPGGYVMDSKPGLYQNVLVLDFKSLYPSIIRTFKVDPMGLIEGLIQAKIDSKNSIVHFEKVISGFDGAYFSRTAHFLPGIIESLWLERDKAKLQKNAALSQAIKIIMNSFYGVLGSTGCRFFDPRLSGSITKRSHEILKTTSAWIEKLGHQVIYGDTDSIFVSIGAEKSTQQAQSLGLELQKIINNKWQQNLKEDFAIKSHLDIEFETHFTRFFMPSIRGVNNLKDQKSIGTKKRYAGLVKGKLIFKGLETVRSDWTALSKTFQQELYRRIFNDLPIDDYIKHIVDELKHGQHDEQLIYAKKIRRPLNDYVNTPPHIKAALIANANINSDKLQGLGMNKVKYKHRSLIYYVMTLDGVQPLDYISSQLDYDFYIEKQLKPIADDILPFIGKNFESIAGKQMGLF